MKKLLIPIIALSAVMFACKKSENVNPAPTPSVGSDKPWLSDTLNAYYELYGDRPPYIFYHRGDAGSSFVTDTIYTQNATRKVKRRADDAEYRIFATMGSMGTDADTLHITARFKNKSVSSSKPKGSTTHACNLQLINLK